MRCVYDVMCDVYSHDKQYKTVYVRSHFGSAFSSDTYLDSEGVQMNTGKY